MAASVWSLLRVQRHALAVRFMHRATPLQGTMVVRLPALSPTMTEGSIVDWHKKEGDQVMVGDVLFDIETDKATMAVESTEDGYLAKILVGPHSNGIPLNTAVALLTEEAGETPVMPAASPKQSPTAEAAAASSPTPPAPSTSPAAAAHPSPAAAATTRPLSPAVRALVEKHSLDAASIPATGPKGYLLKGDVLAFLDHGATAGRPPATAQPTATPSIPSKSAAPKPSPPKTASSVETGSQRKRQRGFQDIPASNMRKVIATRLTQSKSTIPHAYALADINVTGVVARRKALMEATGIKFSLNDIIIKAAALACRAVPAVNSSFDEVTGSVRRNASVDVSIAVATPGGLLTPIIGNADAQSVGAIAQSAAEMASRAREGRLLPHEYQGGTFSISNLGMFGVMSFTAVINPPHACNLAVGATRAVPHPTEGSRTLLSVQLSSDERVVSQDAAAHWLDVFRAYLEQPEVVLKDLHYRGVEE